MQCLTSFLNEREYSIPPRRIKGREIYTFIEYDTNASIEVYIKVFAPCGFSATCVRAHCQVTVDSYAWRRPVNETKMGDSRGRSRQVFCKETLSSPNFLQRRFRKASPKSNLT